MSFIIIRATAGVVSDAIRVVRVLGMAAKQLSPEDLSSVYSTMVHTVQQLNAPPSLLSSLITSLAKLADAQHAGDLSTAIEAVQAWAKPMLSTCEDSLRQFVLCETPHGSSFEGSFNGSFEAADVDVVCCSLFAVGELAALGLDDTRQVDNAAPAESTSACTCFPFDACVPVITV